MSDERARVNVNLTSAARPNDRRQTAIVRIYASDFALVGEGLAGSSIEVPMGENYFASVVAPDGKPVGLPRRFDVRSRNVTVNLEARPNSTPERGVDIFDSGGMLKPQIVAFDAETQLPWKALRQSGLRRSSGIDGDQYLFGPSYDGAPDLVPTQMALVGPGRTCVALIPFDQQDGETKWPSVGWITTESEHILPVVDFDDDRISALQDALRYRMLSPARSAAEAAMEDLAHQAMREKMRSPLAAVLGGLLLLHDAPQRLERIEEWTRNLYNWFPWLSDALPLRVELLARMGRHIEALKVLEEVEKRGTPWTREGLRILVARMTGYNGQTTQDRLTLKVPDELILRYRNLLAETDSDFVYLYINKP